MYDPLGLMYQPNIGVANTYTVLHKYRLWQYGLWSFQMGGIKLNRFLPKNQHTKRNFENFENCTNGEPQYFAKIRVFEVDYFDFFCKKIEKLV